jgi:hypothetical protein
MLIQRSDESDVMTLRHVRVASKVEKRLRLMGCQNNLTLNLKSTLKLSVKRVKTPWKK